MAADGGHSPLEQFVIKTLVPLEVGGVDVSFTNSALFMTIAVVVASSFLALGMRRCAIVPGRWLVAAEPAYEFIAGSVKDTIGQ